MSAVSEPEEEIVVTSSGRLVGCRGRVLVAVLVLAVLLILLLAFLVRAMLMPTAPQPVRRASADAPPVVEAAAVEPARRSESFDPRA